MLSTARALLPPSEFKRFEARVKYVSALNEAINLRHLGVISSLSVARLEQLVLDLSAENERDLSKHKPH